MKFIFNFLPFIAFLFYSLGSNASPLAQLPNLDEVIPLGRLLVYPTASGNSVFVPTAFEQTLECNAKGVCTFSLFNRFSEEELTLLSQNPAARPELITADLNRDVVNLQDARLSGEIASLQNNFFFMSNLAILQKPYGIAYFKPNNPADVMAKYESTGLGQFQIAYLLQGTVTAFEIKIEHNDLLQFMDQYLMRKKVTFQELKVLIHSHLQVKVTGYDSDDVPAIIAYELKSKCLSSTKKGLLSVDTTKRDAFLAGTPSTWNAGLSTLHGSKLCKINLEIKAHANMTQTCEVSHEDAP